MSNNIFSYTNRSYEESRQEGISKIPIISNGDYTDLNTTDPGIIILDYVHALVDMVQFYMDHNALEAFLSTAKERKNIFRLAKQLGYDVRCSKGSTCDVVFSIEDPKTSVIKIPVGTSLATSTNPRVPFMTTVESYIYPGQTSVTVPCVQSILREMEYTGTGKSSLDSIPGSEDQYVDLPVQGVDLDSIYVIDDTNFIWNKVDNITFSNTGSKDYEAYLMYDGTVRVQFGNDERGYTPRETDILSIYYSVNLGSEGRVAANSVTIINSNGTFETEDGETVSLSVTNPLASVGGSDPEDSESIRNSAPAIIKSQDRAVTLADYEALAKRVSGVKDAKAYDINTAPDECLYYEVKVMIIPDGDSVTSELKKNVYDYLYKRITPPTVLTIISPVYESIDIATSVVISNNYQPEAVTYSITEALSAYFDTITGSLGETINPNTLISVITKVEGVQYVNDITPSTPITLGSKVIPRLGKTDITVIRRDA